MLREIRQVRQVRGEPRRRWFSSPSCDLIVWLDEREAVVGFQLCYDKGADEHALTWNARGGYSHTSIDAGEVEPLKYKSAPILVANGKFDAVRVGALFRRESVNLPREYADVVSRKIEEYAQTRNDDV